MTQVHSMSHGGDGTTTQVYSTHHLEGAWWSIMLVTYDHHHAIATAVTTLFHAHSEAADVGW